MPEFILQEYKRPIGRPEPKFIFTKNEYVEGVKMADWDRRRQGDPKDNNPYNPPGGSQFLSTYNRMASYPEEDHFKTTTQMMLEQVHLKKEMQLARDRKPMISYTTFKEICPPSYPYKCSTMCAPDYISTMQDSYKMPHPYVMQRLALPVPPYMQYRRMFIEDPISDETKFFDDCYIQRVKRMQEVKKKNHISYVPGTEEYTDGTSILPKPRECCPLPYSHVK